jgi:hypothetical protein
MKTKKATISITDDELRQAKAISRVVLGHVNFSGLIRYWINQNSK